jgi:Glycosyltransferase
VFFDFERGEDRKARISEKITCYRFAIYESRRKSFAKTAALCRLIKNIFYLLKISREKRINCVESHEAVFLGFIGLALSRAISARFVLHMNTSYETMYEGTGEVSVKFLRFRGIERWLERMVTRSADVIVADRSAYRDSPVFPIDCVSRYVTTGIKVGKEHYSDPSLRRDMKKVLGIEGKNAVLYVGRLHPVKHVCDLVDAFKKIYEKNRNAVLIIAGEGILRKKLENMVDENALGGKVLFLGSRNGKELADLFSTADVLVPASRRAGASRSCTRRDAVCRI